MGTRETRAMDVVMSGGRCGCCDGDDLGCYISIAREKRPETPTWLRYKSTERGSGLIPSPPSRFGEPGHVLWLPPS